MSNSKYSGVKLYQKKNGAGKVTSYSLNVSFKEASALNFIDTNMSSYPLQKLLLAIN